MEYFSSVIRIILENEKYFFSGSAGKLKASFNQLPNKKETETQYCHENKSVQTH